MTFYMKYIEIKQLVRFEGFWSLVYNISRVYTLLWYGKKSQWQMYYAKNLMAWYK